MHLEFVEAKYIMPLCQIMVSSACHTETTLVVPTSNSSIFLFTLPTPYPIPRTQTPTSLLRGGIFLSPFLLPKQGEASTFPWFQQCHPGWVSTCRSPSAFLTEPGLSTALNVDTPCTIVPGLAPHGEGSVAQLGDARALLARST